MKLYIYTCSVLVFCEDLVMKPWVSCREFEKNEWNWPGILCMAEVYPGNAHAAQNVQNVPTGLS